MTGWIAYCKSLGPAGLKKSCEVHHSLCAEVGGGMVLRRVIKSLMMIMFVFTFPIYSNAKTNTEEQGMAVKPVVISGFDDVLRQAENTGIFRATLKIFEDDMTFVGMPELYSAFSMKRSYPNFFLVSAISNWFDHRIERFLTTSKFPSNQRYLRNWLTQWSIEDFKIEKIKDILFENSNQKFIVIFDNSDASISLAQSLNKKFSNQIIAIYLRQVIEKTVPVSAIGFYTAFDIALGEYSKQRMTVDEVQAVGKAILDESNVKKLIPRYAICPENYDPCVGIEGEMVESCKQVMQHVRALCETE